ncbi:MAG: DUF2809 domain-containing protein [Verrucomicrobiota bacterium]
MANPASKQPGSSAATRTAAVILLVLVAAAGLASKFYRGPAADWVNNSLGGVFYVVFWCLLAFLLLPRARPCLIACTVLVITCLLEFLQSWHPAWLEQLRSSFLGAALLGTSFAWSDFPYYFLGCGLGWYWMRRPSRTRVP